MLKKFCSAAWKKAKKNGMQSRRDFFRSLEAGVIGLFLIQSIRFLYGTLYARISSADLVGRIIDRSALINLPGYVEPADVQRELFAVSLALLAPLLALIFGRMRWGISLTVALCVVGRTLALQVPESAALAAALSVGAAMLYLALIIIRRPYQLPQMLLLGVVFDILIRATWHSADPTWRPDYEFTLFGITWVMDTVFIGVTVVVLLLSGYTTFLELEVVRLYGLESEKRGMITGWGSIALGGFFFIELTLLGLANAVARWSDVDYGMMVPLLLMVTSLPLVPKVRLAARQFIASFDGVWRGLLWALLIGFWFVLGSRFDGVLSAGVLLLAQLMVGLALWWIVVERKEDDAANPTPVLLLFSIVIFAVLSIGDYFTYDYAYVRDFAPPFDLLAEVLRSMRDMGLALFLAAAILVALPIILERRVIPWRDGRGIETFFAVVMTFGLAFGGMRAADPPPVRGPANVNCIRVGSLNIHSGYTLLFAQNLQDIVYLVNAQGNPETNAPGFGVDILLLQEVDAGRLSSFGVDQAEWLARELGMEVYFFPQNEFLQGMAILSRVPIREAHGELLFSSGPQAAVQYVELGLDENPFHVYNVWLGFKQVDANGQTLPEEQQDQTQQTAQLRRIIANRHAPNFDERILMGGTFNYDTDSNLYRFWSQESPFIDPFTGLREEDTDTIFLVDGTAARFDYIWVSRALTLSGANIDKRTAVSDHRLSIIEINMRPDLQQCR